MRTILIANRWSRRAVVLLGLWAVGCSPPTSDVSGTVKFQGKPLQTGYVEAIDADGMPHGAAVARDGRYLIAAIPSGPVRVAVGSPKPPPPTLPPGLDPKQAAAIAKKQEVDWFPIPKQYEATNTSGLTATLAPGENSFDIDLR